MRWVYRLEYAAGTALRGLLRLAPLKVSAAVVAWIARNLGPLAPFDRRARRNLALIRPHDSPAEQRRIRRRMYDNFARTLVEYQHAETLLARAEDIEIVGAEHVAAAREAGRGAVLVSAHYGNWEIPRLAMRTMGWPCGLIYRAFNNPLVDAKCAAVAAQIGEPVCKKGGYGLRTLIRHVGGGGAMMMLIDQRFSGAPALPFLGKPATTSLAAAEIALSRGAALLPVRGERLADGGWRAVFEPPIPPPEGLDRAEAALAMTRAANARISAWIEADPGLWFWLHNRWGKPKP